MEAWIHRDRPAVSSSVLDWGGPDWGRSMVAWSWTEDRLFFFLDRWGLGGGVSMSPRDESSSDMVFFIRY